MDTTTHALTGYIISRAGLDKNTEKWGIVSAIAAAVFPDLDLVLGIFGTELSFKYHRSLTNSVFLIVPFSLFFAWLFVKISRKKNFWDFFWIWVVVISVHTFQDLVTSYGTMILSPFSDTRFALDWLFIIDLYLVGALLLPLLVSFFWKKAERTLARISLGIAALYVGLCAYHHSQALWLAQSFVKERGLKPMAVASIPQPLSPFHWANFILTEEKIYQGLVNLIAKEEKNPDNRKRFLGEFKVSYQPVSRLRYTEWARFDNTPWVEKAMKLTEVQDFFWFARFPIVRDLGVLNGKRRVEFYDLRFGQLGGRRPFIYVVEFDESGKVVFQGFL
jgi:inner membrane protein